MQQVILGRITTEFLQKDRHNWQILPLLSTKGEKFIEVSLILAENYWRLRT